MKLLFALIQHCLPKQWLSRRMGSLAETKFKPVKYLFIFIFIKIFKVNMQEAELTSVSSYVNFNDFFTRALKPETRPVCGEQEEIACPADGTISQLGDIDGGCILQAKGKEFTVTELLGGDEYLSQNFAGGKFLTVYLSPKDYHRVHMPYGGQLQTMVHVPGSLFSVNKATTENISRLFARNERVVSVFDTVAGPMAVVMVGAMIVASIETVWAGQITPYQKIIRISHYPENREEINLTKGEEMGRFKLGSTVVVLFGPDMVEWDTEFAAGASVKMGQRLGTLINV